jgi:hypothetical protein
MPGHSRSKNGVTSLAYVAGIHVFAAARFSKAWMAGINPAMTNESLRNDRVCIRVALSTVMPGHND